MVRMPESPDFIGRSDLVAAAYRFAINAHTGPRRRGNTDPFHPVQVAELLAAAGYRDEVVAAALLHDVLEDTDTSPDELREQFGDAVTDLVLAVTEDPAIESYEDRKADLREKTCGSKDSAAIFAADKLAKVRGAAGDPGRLSEPQLDHYRRTYAAYRVAYPDLPFLEQLDQGLSVLSARRADASPA
jgi:guanosine-3',5'-bis(diphosphate) 3'-pyrophosphohydrolase